MASESEIENKILAKGLTAPRLTPDLIDSKIIGENYYVVPNTTVTLCTLFLENGFTVTGESAAVSADNFDAEIGITVARQNAREKIWQLEGYLLKQRIFEGRN